MIKHIINILMDIIFAIPIAFIFLYFLVITFPSYIKHIINRIHSINKKSKEGRDDKRQ